MLMGRLASYHARHSSDAIAVIDGPRRLTYALLNGRANRLANALTGLGLKQGEHGAILMRNQHQFLEAYLAYSKLGMTAVLLNFRLSSSELAYQLEDSEARVLVVDGEFVPALEASVPQLPNPPLVISTGRAVLPGMLDYEETLARASSDEPPEERLSTDDRNLILYTSGTTGFPKGAMLTHSNQFWSSLNIRQYYGHSPADRSLVTLPLYHTAALNFSAVPFLHAGGSVVLQRNYEPDEVLALIEREACTSLFLLPQMWGEIARRPLKRFRLGSMQHLIGGGALSPEPEIERLLTATGGAYSFLMGMTEVGTFLNYLAPADWLRKNGAVGKPTLHAAVRVVDDTMTDVAPGEIGEMVVRGPTVFSGYWRKPQETVDAFTGPWFHSGDLVRVDNEGFLYIVDRKKDMVRSGGENIYSVEVERVLERHSAVAEAAVIGVADPYWGESVRAVVVLEPQQDASPELLADWCRQHLASYKKPRSFVFVDALPRSATGKIFKHVLRERYGSPGQGCQSGVAPHQPKPNASINQETGS